MAGYISARFEKTDLPTSGLVRIVVRNLDQGTVPPAPTSSYFPTEPNTLRPFLVLEYVSDSVGERYVRVADLSDLTTYSQVALDTFEDGSADFVSAGVIPGDLITVFPSDTEQWTSEEYPGSTFTFSVASVLSATQIQLTKPLPVFQRDLSWAIDERGISGTTGITRRNGSPAVATTFLDVRFNNYFSDALTAENFTVAVKSGLDGLATESTGSGLTSESYTATP